jgi:hypothetical protein
LKRFGVDPIGRRTIARHRWLVTVDDGAALTRCGFNEGSISIEWSLTPNGGFE